MKKQNLSEELNRMKGLAGLINENDSAMEEGLGKWIAKKLGVDAETIDKQIADEIKADPIEYFYKVRESIEGLIRRDMVKQIFEVDPNNSGVWSVADPEKKAEGIVKFKLKGDPHEGNAYKEFEVDLNNLRKRNEEGKEYFDSDAIKPTSQVFNPVEKTPEQPRTGKYVPPQSIATQSSSMPSSSMGSASLTGSRIGGMFENEIRKVVQEVLSESFKEYSPDALKDMIINLSRFENTDEDVKAVKDELERLKDELERREKENVTEGSNKNITLKDMKVGETIKINSPEELATFDLKLDSSGQAVSDLPELKGMVFAYNGVSIARLK